MLIKNFKVLALNKERRIALEIVEAGLYALDYERILHGLNGFETDNADKEYPYESVLDQHKSANVPKGTGKLCQYLKLDSSFWEKMFAIVKRYCSLMEKK
jgi:3-methyladenine DNA glycosylase Mpg